VPRVVRLGLRAGSWRVATQPWSTSRPRKAVICRPFMEWRDPDSNRGHHDFQAPAQGGERCWFAGVSQEQGVAGCRLFPAVPRRFRPRAGRSWPKLRRASVVRPVDGAGRAVLRMDRQAAHGTRTKCRRSHRRWGANCARGLLLGAQFNVGAPGTWSRTPVGQGTRVGPAATGGRITAGPRLPCSVGTSKRLLALHPVRDLAGGTTSGTRVLRPPAAVARPEVLGHQGLRLTPCQTS
jgi:hypothetical protein